VSKEHGVNLWQMKFRDIVQAVSCSGCNKLQGSIQTKKSPLTFFTRRAIKYLKNFASNNDENKHLHAYAEMGYLIWFTIANLRQTACKSMNGSEIAQHKV